MKRDISPGKIQKTIVSVSAAGILVIGFVVAAVCIVPLSDSLKASREQALLNTLNSKKISVEQYLQTIKGVARQISSRSKARQDLMELNRGLMDPSVFMGSTIMRLSEAMRAAELVKGVARFDQSGAPLIRIGTRPPESIRVDPKDMRTLRVLGPLKIEDKLFLAIQSPIISPRTKELAGADMVLFDMGPLKSILRTVENTNLNYLSLLFRRTSSGTRPVYISSHGFITDKQPTLPGLGGLFKAVQSESGGLRRWGADNSSDYVYAFQRLSHPEWTVAVGVDSRELYWPPYRQILLTGVVILILVALGAMGIWLLLRPLTGKMIMRSDQLEHEIETKTKALQNELKEREKVESALRESEERFRLLSEQSLLAILALQDGSFKYVNDAAASLLEYSKEEIMSWGPWEFLNTVHPEDREFVGAQSKKKMAGSDDTVAHYSFRISAQSGATKWVDIYSKTAAYEGRPADLITLLDRTDQKRAEQLLLQTERIKAIGEMAGGVAHNFNNILQIVAGGAQMALTNLELGNLAKIHSNLEQILESSRLGAETVKRLQDFARIRVDSAVVEGRVFDLSHCVNQAIDMSEPWWKTKPAKDGVTITLERDLESGLMIMGRRSELFEVVVNLIKNSVEAMAGGGGIFIGAKRVGNKVLLTVRDTGPGIDPNCLGKVFEPFWTTKGAKGTGMGLASAYGVVKAHGGELSVRNSPNGGAQFTVELPGSSENIEEIAPAPGYDIDFKCSILIIDDVEPLLEVLKEGLTSLGQEVYTANSGRKGLEIYGRSTVDVVVCDLGMEEMNGWQVASALNEMARGRGKPRPCFILLTGWAGQTSGATSYKDAHVDTIVEKPVIVVDLLKIIKRVIETTSRERERVESTA